MAANIIRSGDIEELFGISKSSFFEMEIQNRIPINYRKSLFKTKQAENQTLNYSLLELANKFYDGNESLASLAEQAEFYLKRRRFKEAEEILLESLELEPFNLHPRLELAKIYQRQRNFEKAERILFEALEIDSSNIESRLELAKIYQQTRQFEKAEELLIESLRIDPIGLYPRLELARIYQKTGQFEKAEELLIESLRIDPLQLQPRTELARIYQLQGRSEDAQKVLLESIELAPQDKHIRHKLSELYLEEGKFDLAKIVLEKDFSLTISDFGEMLDDNSPAFLVVGYGVTRRIEDTVSYSFSEESKSRRLRYSRVASLFENHYRLVPLQSWLPELKSNNRGRYTQVINLINSIIPDDTKFEGEFIRDEYHFNFRGSSIPFGALSDGYRHFIGWLADLLYHICFGCPKGKKLVDSKGIVLVDEIDLLLHPKWQRTVIETLSKELPNIQFIFTTHSPIILSSVEKNNIFVMELDNDGTAIAKQYDENIYGSTAEQALLSSYFDLDTSRPQSFVDSELLPLSQKAMNGDEEASVNFLRKLNEPMNIDKSKFSEFLK